MDPHDDAQDSITRTPGIGSNLAGKTGTRIQRERPVALAFEAQDLGLSLLSPARIVEVLLTDWPRLAKSVAEKRFLGRLGLILLLVSAVASIPYGAVLREDGFWRISAVFVGSLAICFPSLFIFSAYLGCRVDFRQNLVLSLLITSVSAIFSFGFFPILWFLDETMTTAASTIGTREISMALLGIALLAGIVHLMRCMFADTSLTPKGSYSSLIMLWMALLVFISIRMGITLDVL